VPLFAKTPQQSDYVEMWRGAEIDKANLSSSDKIKNILKKNESIRKFLSNIKQKQINSRLRREKSFANSKAFKPVDK
jgi:predicted transcriptional regulator